MATQSKSVEDYGKQGGEMVKIFLVLLLCIGFTGCAYNEFSGTYKDALKSRAIITITKEGNYQELMQKVAGYFASRGYNKVIYADQKSGFFVYAKEGDFEEPCQIILKYTRKTGEDKIRIDMVKGSDELVTDGEVSNDIQEIAGQIKGD